ncbi:MAG: hypothetical protein E7483_07475 [Ruminococcaceae bacterium]|nr:hypothetical protein [Oscillospiraceae bacterium]
MKKLISLMVFMLSITVIFTACSSGRSYPNLVGVVQAVEFAEQYKNPVYTITTDSNCTVKVVMKDGAVAFSWVDKWDDAALVTGGLSEFDKVKIITDYDARKVKKSSDEIIVVDAMWINEVFYADAKILADGTAVGMWDDGFNVIYQLGDGTELIRINGSSGPDNVYVGNRLSFDSFNEEAKPVVLQYYNDRGLLYDADALLEQAYQWYKKDKENFGTKYVDQSVSPSASNENIMCFLTTVTLPHTNGNMGQEIRLGEIFDIKTGNHINGFDIFNCTPEKAIDVILDQTFSDVDFNTTNIEDVDKFRAEIKAAFKPEYIVLWNESMEISFPAGSLPTEDHCYIVGIEYTDEIKAIMHPWAIPDTEW